MQPQALMRACAKGQMPVMVAGRIKTARIIKLLRIVIGRDIVHH